ncbi:MAG: hypothetical protein IT423_09780 [Pirellulaceae bacterium]|nr:hypothetical protein [Pirellulaceae bacterium]
MSLQFKLVGCVLAVAASGLLVPSTSVAQDEPIAVAAPIAESAAKESAKETPATATGQDVAQAEASDKRVRPLTVSVQLLRSDLIITGALTDSTLLMLKTAFGEASIPLSEVAGVRFPSGQDTSTTLVMLNGDSITGASDVKAVTVETEWGSAKINGENISSMMFVPGLEWQSVNGLNGTRWSLTEAKAKPTAPSSGPVFGNQPGQVGLGQSGSLLPPSNPSSSNSPRVVFPRSN